MLERTDAITIEILEPIPFVLAYPNVFVKCEAILLFLIQLFYYQVSRTWLYSVVWIGMMSVSLSANNPTSLHLISKMSHNLPLRSLRPAGAALNRYAVLQQSLTTRSTAPAPLMRQPWAPGRKNITDAVYTGIILSFTAPPSKNIHVKQTKRKNWASEGRRYTVKPS
jgi:hypothetical protein